jgi:3-hydroxyacyl-[acyl-carrier-protein] dehydratase
MIYDQEQIKSYLPHRDPFLFVNKILEINLPDTCKKRLKPEERQVKDLIGGKVVSQNSVLRSHPIFAGHFPNKPILPGVIQVEMIAQTSSFLFTALKSARLGSYGVDVALLGIEKTRFKHLIQPDVELRVETTMLNVRKWLVVFEGSIYMNDQLCSQSEFMARIDFI